MKKKIIAIALCAALAVGGVVAGSLAWLQDSTGEVKNTFTVGNISIDLKEHPLKADGSGELNTDTTVDLVTANSYKMVPGDTLNKDPFVTVKANSEKCYLFVTVAENMDSTITYDDDNNTETPAVALTFRTLLDYKVCLDDAETTGEVEGWTELKDASGNQVIKGNAKVYYRVVEASNNDQTFYVLKDNAVKVNDDVTKAMMDALQTKYDAASTEAKAAVLPNLTFKAAAVQFKNITDVNAAWTQVEGQM